VTFTQSGGSFTGDSTVTIPFPSTGPISGQIDASGAVDGIIEYQREIVGAGIVVSQGTFTGTLSGDNLTIDFQGQDVSGDTCSFTGSLSGLRGL